MRRLLVLALFTLPAMAAAMEERPFDAPPEMQSYARKTTMLQPSNAGKAQAFLRVCFLLPSEGGLGIVYDNGYTRSVAEVWRDRKANCLSLTAFFYAACKSINVEASFAESPSVSQWRRVGPFIRHELHVVALVRQLPLTDLVADFMPEMRKGFYLVHPMTESRARALFYSNRAVECLEAGDIRNASLLARKGLEQDEGCGAAWNIQGVVFRTAGDNASAEQAFLKALSVNVKDGAALGNLETLYRSSGQFEVAMAYRRMSLLARAQDPYFQAFLAEEAAAAGDYNQAVKCLERAIRLQKMEPDFYLQLSRVYQLKGETQEAVEVLAKGQKLMDPQEQVRFQSKLAKLRASA